MSSSWRDSGHSKGYLHFSTFPYGNGGTKFSKKCWNVTDPPIIMVVCKAFFDVGLHYPETPSALESNIYLVESNRALVQLSDLCTRSG